MNKEQKLQRMKDSLEQLRIKEYPDIPASLVNDLLDSLSDSFNNDMKASNEVRDILLNYFNTK